jgi:BirA family biotin operon repressor/biotin-[acetyl-CoA-carboxylase] ligase
LFFERDQPAKLTKYILYKIPTRTLFAGKNLVYVPQCHSTNTLAAELGQKVETPEGTVVITDHQTAGRGQRGNTWEAHPGKNLTFSLILKPGFLAAKDQFQLNEAISVGIAHYIACRVVRNVAIKWPNDILVQDKKVCGILIENHINSESISCSIVGIGLNINQQSFIEPSAESIGMITGKEYHLRDEFEALLHIMEGCYLDLRNGKQAELENRYLDLLYRKDEIHLFTSHGEVFEGIISGVNEDGKLRIKVGGVDRIFGAKEVAFLN